MLGWYSANLAAGWLMWIWTARKPLSWPQSTYRQPELLRAAQVVSVRTGGICEDCETARYRDPELSNGAATTVELRSTGLQTVVGPSTHPDGSTYEMLDTEPATVPAALLQLAVEGLHEAILKERGHEKDGTTPSNTNTPSVGAGVPLGSRNSTSDRPGDDYNERGDLHALLLQHGWQVTGKNGNNVQLTRPGKTAGLSATWNGEHFYVFSSSCPEFEPDKGYRPFEAYTRLEHNGDHTAAAAELGQDMVNQSRYSWTGRHKLCLCTFLLTRCRDAGAGWQCCRGDWIGHRLPCTP